MLLYCSMQEGKYTALLPRINRYLDPHGFHYGSEIIFSTHTSPVVPKESPLKVRMFSNNMPLDHCTFLNVCTVSGATRQEVRMDERYGNNPKDGKGLCQRYGSSNDLKHDQK